MADEIDTTAADLAEIDALAADAAADAGDLGADLDLDLGEIDKEGGMGEDTAGIEADGDSGEFTKSKSLLSKLRNLKECVSLCRDLLQQSPGKGSVVSGAFGQERIHCLGPLNPWRSASEFNEGVEQIKGILESYSHWEEGQVRNGASHQSLTRYLLQNQDKDRDVSAIEQYQKALVSCGDLIRRNLRDVPSDELTLKRLEGIANTNQLAFTIDDQTEEDVVSAFINSEMFYVEVAMRKGTGELKTVKIVHNSDMDNEIESPALVEALKNGDYGLFARHIQGLASLYRPNVSTDKKVALYNGICSVEKDLELLAELEGLADPNQGHGVILSRDAGVHLRVQYFTSQSVLPTKKKDPSIRTCRLDVEEGTDVTTVLHRRIGKPGEEPEDKGMNAEERKVGLADVVVYTYPEDAGADETKKDGGDTMDTDPSEGKNNKHNLLKSHINFCLVLDQPMLAVSTTAKELNQPWRFGTASDSGATDVHITSDTATDNRASYEHLSVQGCLESEWSSKAIRKGEEITVPHTVDGQKLTMSFRTSKTKHRGFLIHRVYFNDVLQVYKILQTLRKQAAFNALFNSCITPLTGGKSELRVGDEEEGASTGFCEIIVDPPHQLSLLIMPGEGSDGMLTCRIRVGLGGVIKVTVSNMSSTTIDTAQVTSTLTKMLAKAMSVPVAVAHILEICQASTGSPAPATRGSKRQKTAA
eukprot:Clim_evm6s65 gene=Clim_evmTU6s65